MDKKVYFNIKVFDVKYLFWIFLVGGKFDVNIENDNKFWLVFDFKKLKEVNGVFYGKCVEFCGLFYFFMDFKVWVVLSDEFDMWVKDLKKVKFDVEIVFVKVG